MKIPHIFYSLANTFLSLQPTVQHSLEAEKTWLQCQCERWGLREYLKSVYLYVDISRIILYCALLLESPPLFTLHTVRSNFCLCVCVCVGGENVFDTLLAHLWSSGVPKR